MISNKILGRDTIKMMKDIFNIGDVSIKSLILRASCDDVTTMEIESLVSLNDIDIKTKEIDKDIISEVQIYEVSIRKITSNDES